MKQFMSSSRVTHLTKPLVLVLLAGFTIFQATAAPLNDWPSRQSLDVTAPGLVRVTLPAETFDAAQSSLADLRLLDQIGRAHV